MMTAGIAWIALTAAWLAQDYFRYAKVWARIRRFFRWPNL
jgi:hypothetical protein